MKSIITLLLLVAAFAQQGTRELGRFGGTGTAPGMFKNPAAIDITADGKVFVCDRGNNRIQVFDLKGNFLINIGGFGWEAEQFDEPADVWARSTINIWVADYNNQRVQRFDKDLNYIGELRSNEGDDERFQFREVLSAAYSPQGDLFVLEAGEYKVVKFNSRSQAEIAFGYYESGSGELEDPQQIDLGSGNRVFISDGAGTVHVYDYFGNFMFDIKIEEFQHPAGIATDKKGNLYVCDPPAKKIFIFSESGQYLRTIEQISGLPLRNPTDLAVLEKANGVRPLYVIDGDEIRIVETVFSAKQER